MKNYNEMTNDVFRRIDEYNAKQKQKKSLLFARRQLLSAYALPFLRVSVFGKAAY